MSAPSGRMALLLILLFFGIFVAFVLTPLALAPLGIFAGLAHGVRSVGMGSWHFHPWFPFFPIWGFSLFFFVLWIVVLVWVYKDAERRGMSGVLWALLVFFGNLIGLLIFLIVRQDHPLPRGPEPRRSTGTPGPAGSGSGSASASGGGGAAPCCGPAGRAAGGTGGQAPPASSAAKVEPGAPAAAGQAQPVQPPQPPPAEGLSCPSCRKPVEKGFAFCPHCGVALQPVCKSCGKPADPSWKTCPYCGSPLKSD